MREPWEIVEALEADNSRLGKEAIIKTLPPTAIIFSLPVPN